MSKANVSHDRQVSIDLLRGLVMILMVLDHARDFFFGLSARPTDLSVTTPVLFFSRWVTHFCAPVFVFLAGTSAYLYGRTREKGALSRFLLTRGLWLVFLELTVIRLGFTPDPFYHFTLIQVIWAIGWSMVALAALCWLPPTALVGVAVLIIAGHNLLDGIHAPDIGRLGWLWSIFHERGRWEPLARHQVLISYPLLPWIGVIAAGFAYGAVQDVSSESRTRITRRLGGALLVAFVVLRAINVYGDPGPWKPQKTALFTLLSFLNTEKYPPSLLFLLMTLGPALLLLAGLENTRLLGTLRPIAIFGRVPLLFYVAHLYLLRYVAVFLAILRFGSSALKPLPGHAGSPQYPLWVTFVAWGIAVVVLYPLCRWFADIKKRRRQWWLSYL